MTDQDTIRKAIKLADGFDLKEDQPNIHTQYGPMNFASDEPLFLDALAAQLVRQVDALKAPNPDYVRRTIFGIYADSVSLIEFDGGMYEETVCEDGNRTMNTIKAIIDSGVLASASDKKCRHLGSQTDFSSGVVTCDECGEQI